ncbi:MAG: hypothetical protein ABSG86_31335 [Thermoguttaceae bacterium]|jgi:hypothetical protein
MSRKTRWRREAARLERRLAAGFLEAWYKRRHYTVADQQHKCRKRLAALRRMLGESSNPTPLTA